MENESIGEFTEHLLSGDEHLVESGGLETEDASPIDFGFTSLLEEPELDDEGDYEVGRSKPSEGGGVWEGEEPSDYGINPATGKPYTMAETTALDKAWNDLGPQEQASRERRQENARRENLAITNRMSGFQPVGEKWVSFGGGADLNAFASLQGGVDPSLGKPADFAPVPGLEIEPLGNYCPTCGQALKKDDSCATCDDDNRNVWLTSSTKVWNTSSITIWETSSINVWDTSSVTHFTVPELIKWVTSTEMKWVTSSHWNDYSSTAHTYWTTSTHIYWTTNSTRQVTHEEHIVWETSSRQYWNTSYHAQWITSSRAYWNTGD